MNGPDASHLLVVLSSYYYYFFFFSSSLSFLKSTTFHEAYDTNYFSFLIRLLKLGGAALAAAVALTG